MEDLKVRIEVEWEYDESGEPVGVDSIVGYAVDSVDTEEEEDEKEVNLLEQGSPWNDE